MDCEICTEDDFDDDTGAAHGDFVCHHCGRRVCVQHITLFGTPDEMCCQCFEGKLFG